MTSLPDYSSFHLLQQFNLLFPPFLKFHMIEEWVKESDICCWNQVLSFQFHFHDFLIILPPSASYPSPFFVFSCFCYSSSSFSELLLFTLRALSSFGSGKSHLHSTSICQARCCHEEGLRFNWVWAVLGQCHCSHHYFKSLPNNQRSFHIDPH